MKYIYGPVKSRRLGLSLGVSLTPHKICTFDCVYCQLGPTTQKTTERKEYVKAEEVIGELKSWLVSNPAEASSLDYISLSGAGEPTLNINIGAVVAQIKKITAVPVAVITNASLLSDASVRQAISGADLIVPSLDTVIPKAFQNLDRPETAVSLENIISGLVNLKKEFRGKIWLEVMLVRGLNDDLRYIKKLKEAIGPINPDKIHLNSPVRSACEPGVLAVGRKKLEESKYILGESCEII